MSSWHSRFTPVLTLMASQEYHVTYSFVLINRERLLFHPALTSGILLCSCFRVSQEQNTGPCVFQKTNVPAGGAILSPWTCFINVSCVLLLLQVFLQMFWLINLFFYGSWIVSHSWKDLDTLRLQRYSSVFSSNIQKIEFWHKILDPVIVCINVFLIYFFIYDIVKSFPFYIFLGFWQLQFHSLVFYAIFSLCSCISAFFVLILSLKQKILY